MYHLLGAKKNLETLLLLSRSGSPNGTAVDTSASVRAGLMRLLSSTQPSVHLSHSAVVDIVTDGDTWNAMCSLFDIVPTSDVEHARIAKSAIVGAVAHLQEVAPQLSALLGLATFTIVTGTSRKAGSETLPWAIGVMLVEPGRAWSRSDVIEGLVHELTHLLLMYDELRFGHYVNKALLSAPEHQSQTGIFNALNAADVVFHSIVVASEVIALRRGPLGEPTAPQLHPASSDIVRAAEVAYASLTRPEQAVRLLTPRARELLDAGMLQMRAATR
jgi:hypothetical protein